METTKSAHNHGGAGWEFGTCLWSPVTNSTGAHSYEIMKEPRTGDLVLHNYHYSLNAKPPRSYLCGFSTIANTVKVRTDEPPSPGDWVGREKYYRIDLKGYSALKIPLDFSVFSKNYSQKLRDTIENDRPKFFPFTISGGIVRMNQGMYLTKVTGSLYSALCDALSIEETDLPAKDKKIAHLSYAEGERSRREVSFFQRNPKLAEDVKKHYDYTCQICGFRPSSLFGNRLQSTGLDCHHLDPMAEREGFSKQSTLQDVIVLCANCHRLVHSKKPALSIENAKSLFKIKPFTLGKSL